MKNLLEKELELIKPILKNKIADFLQGDFKANCGNSVFKVVGIHLGEIFVDTSISNFREDIVINKLKIKARVKLNLDTGSCKETTLSLRLNDIIHLSFHRGLNTYKIINSTYLRFIDLNTSKLSTVA